MADADPSHILFPNDTPSAPAATPEWFTAQIAKAEQRLSGNHGAPKQEAQPSSDDEADAASQIFKDESRFDETAVSSVLEPFALSALSDGDNERADELKHATAALTADFKAAGTDAGDVREVMQVMRERADFIGEPDTAKIEAETVATMAQLQAEGVTPAEIDAARRLINDLDLVSPGLKHSLAYSGAGSDIRVVKSAIREAKRRGYIR